MSLFSFFTRGENYFYPPFFHRIRSGGREGAREQPFLTAQLSKKREGKIGGRVGNETDARRGDSIEGGDTCNVS